MQTQSKAPRFHEPALGYDDGLPYLPRSGIFSRSNSSLFSTLQGMKDQEGMLASPVGTRCGCY
jgi:hypothetical protein